MTTKRILSAAVASVWLAAASNLLWASESAAPARRTICLDGTWQVAEGSMDTIPAQFDHTVPVPGLLDMATPGFETPGSVVSEAERHQFWLRAERGDPRRAAFWYRRTFRVDYPAATVALLKVNKARFGMCVFLNGQKVGVHPYNFTPGWFDLRPYIKTDGSANELLIRVGASLAQVPLSVADGWDFEKSRYIPGIYDSVELILTCSPYVVNVQVAPDVEKSSVRVAIELANAGPAAVAPQVRLTVREAAGGRVCGAKTVAGPRLEPAASGQLDTTVELDEAHCWTPADPFLYELVVDTGADRYETRFGLRSFGTDPARGRVLLNGKPYYLRGSNVCIFRFFEDAQRGSKPWDRQWVRTLHRRFKDMHWNSLRYCIGFPPEMWYEIADEEGLLIQDEFPIWYGGGVPGWPDQLTADNLAVEYTQWMRERWNHPCVVIWDAQNETANDTVIFEAIGRVRKLDLSQRPWDNGWGRPQSPLDVTEYHPYRCNRRDLHPFSLSILERESGIPDIGPRREGHPPYIINEYGWLWLNRDGTPTTLSRPAYDALLGPDATPAELRACYARILAAKTEFWRSRRKCAGVLHFCGLGYSRPGGQTSDNFIDLETLTFEPQFYKYVRDAFAPLGVVLDLWKEQLAPGTRLSLPVLVVNDLDAPWQGEVTLRLEQPGQTIWKHAQKAAAEPLGVARVEFPVQFPGEPGQCELIAEIRGHQNQPVASHRLIALQKGDP